MIQQQELIPMSVGEHLKQQRIIRKLSLATVARAIKLDEKLLGEIEQEQATHVAPIYRNGYIRSYARYLQIPAEEIEGLITEKEVSQPLVRNIFSEPPRHNSVERWLRATSYVLASLLIGTLAWQFTHEAVRLSQNGPQLHSAANNTVDAGDSTTQNSAPEITGPVNASIALLGALHSSDSTGVDAADQAWAAVSQPLLLDGESRLQVSVSADSWVEITDADGVELEMDLLRGGSDNAYKGKPPFRILFGRASAVRMSMDGESVDLSTFTLDDVAQLSWPQTLQADKNGSTDN